MLSAALRTIGLVAFNQDLSTLNERVAHDSSTECGSRPPHRLWRSVKIRPRQSMRISLAHPPINALGASTRPPLRGVDGFAAMRNFAANV